MKKLKKDMVKQLSFIFFTDLFKEDNKFQNIQKFLIFLLII